MEAACTTSGTAADYCANLVLNGYDDWFLPSREELIKIWVNRDLIGGFSNTSGYWSSSETTNQSYAWNVDFSTGLPFSHGKANQYLVRPVRFYATPVPPGSSDSSTCGIPGIHNVYKTYGTITDQEGNRYKTIVIGTQEWMAENLNTSIYRNGDKIENVPSGYFSFYEGGWKYYQNNPSYACPYGKLYNREAVYDARGLCPTGWRVPSKIDWTTLIDFLGGETVALGKMKSINSLWSYPNIDATNSSGFSGVPGGKYYSKLDIAYSKGIFAEWWSTTRNIVVIDGTYSARLSYNSPGIINVADKDDGLSIRCIKD